jgi:hypothetical protein
VRPSFADGALRPRTCQEKERAMSESGRQEANAAPGTALSADHVSTSVGDADVHVLGDLAVLLLGGALESSEAFGRRLRQWHDAIGSQRYDGRDESLPDVLRYALVGLMVESEHRARRQLASIWRLSDEMAWWCFAALRPAASTWPVQRLRRAFDTLLDRWQDDMDRWIWIGRREERRGRLLARQAASSELDALLELLAHQPAVRALIEQQAGGMAESAVGDARDRAAVADDWIERLAHSLMRRSPAAHMQPLTPDAEALVRPAPSE